MNPKWQPASKRQTATWVPVLMALLTTFGAMLSPYLTAEAAPPANRVLTESTDSLNALERPRSQSTLGFGLNLGILPGLKARFLRIQRSGWLIGADADIGTIIWISTATLSGLVGRTLDAQRHTRLYLTIGYGRGEVFALFDWASGSWYQVGAGLEWKPTSWFSLGLEGGASAMGTQNGSSDVFPWGRLNLMVYVH